MLLSRFAGPIAIALSASTWVASVPALADFNEAEAPRAGAGEAGHPEQISPEIRNMSDSDRRALIDGLRRNPKAESVSVLFQLASAESGSDRWVRSDAIDALQRHFTLPGQGERIVSRLTGLLKHAPEDWLQDAAERALEAIATTDYRNQVRRMIADALLPEMAGQNDRLRASAAQILGRTGDARAIEPLSRALVDPSAPRNLRSSSASALGRLAKVRGDRDLVSPLIQAVGNDPDDYVREEAQRALGNLHTAGEARVVSALVAEARRPGTQGLVQIARALGSASMRNNSEAVSALVEILRTAPDAGARTAAAQSLGRHEETRERVRALLAAFSDPSSQVRFQAVESLGFRIRVWLSEGKAFPSEFDAEITQALIGLLGDDDRQTRKEALRALLVLLNDYNQRRHGKSLHQVLTECGAAERAHQSVHPVERVLGGLPGSALVGVPVLGFMSLLGTLSRGRQVTDFRVSDDVRKFAAEEIESLRTAASLVFVAREEPK